MPTVEQRPQSLRGRKPRITEQTKEKAVKLYQEDTLTVQQIADQCGFSVPSLYRILREKGL